MTHNLRLLKYITNSSIGVDKRRGKLKLILYSEEYKAWFDEEKDSDFHSYITISELGEWIFEYVNFTKNEFITSKASDLILDLFYSYEAANVLIALTILKEKAGINSSFFSLLIGAHQAYYPLRNKEHIVDEILALAEEMILKYVPSQIWQQFKQMPGHYANGTNEILNIEVLRFF